MQHHKALTPKELEQLEQMAAINLPQGKIAAILRISESTLERMLKSTPAVREAYDLGRARASHNVRAVLFKMATRESVEKEVIEITVDQNGKEIKREKKSHRKAVDPKFEATKFWCETQEDFKRTDVIETPGYTGPQVFVGLPAKKAINRGR